MKFLVFPYPSGGGSNTPTTLNADGSLAAVGNSTVKIDGPNFTGTFDQTSVTGVNAVDASAVTSLYGYMNVTHADIHNLATIQGGELGIVDATLLIGGIPNFNVYGESAVPPVEGTLFVNTTGSSLSLNVFLQGGPDDGTGAAEALCTVNSSSLTSLNLALNINDVSQGEVPPSFTVYASGLTQLAVSVFNFGGSWGGYYNAAFSISLYTALDQANIDNLLDIIDAAVDSYVTNYGGSVWGSYLYIAGSNSAPSADGLASISDLAGYGVTVVHN